IAARPPSTTTTSQPSLPRTRAQILRMLGSSSTTSTRPRYGFATASPATRSAPAGCRRRPRSQHDLERRSQLLVIPWLGEVAMYGTLVDGPGRDLDVAITRHQKTNSVRILHTDVLQQVEPVRFGA